MKLIRVYFLSFLRKKRHKNSVNKINLHTSILHFEIEIFKIIIIIRKTNLYLKLLYFWLDWLIFLQGDLVLPTWITIITARPKVKATWKWEGTTPRLPTHPIHPRNTNMEVPIISARAVSTVFFKAPSPCINFLNPETWNAI